jgi:hypothetical protein
VNELFNLPNLSGRTRPRGFTQPLTEMSTRSRKIMFLGSKARPVLRIDDLTAISQPYRLPRPVTGLDLLLH